MRRRIESIKESIGWRIEELRRRRREIKEGFRRRWKDNKRK